MKEIEYYGEKFYAKACPCCGGEAKLNVGKNQGMVLNIVPSVYVYCDNCGLRTKTIPVAPHYSAIGVAVNFWNKRVKEGEE